MRNSYRLRDFKSQTLRSRELLNSCHDDLTLLALRGHLLVEEQLFLALTDRLGHEEILASAGLGFRQKMKMVKKLLSGSKLDKCFSEVFNHFEKLNELRNCLAHRIEVKDMNSQVDNFCKQAEQLSKPAAQFNSYDRPERFKVALANLYAAIASLRMID